jgi:hypothetical protein
MHGSLKGVVTISALGPPSSDRTSFGKENAVLLLMVGKRGDFYEALMR